MTNILAIETSSDACSLALSSGFKDSSFHEIIPKPHSEKLFLLIEEMMSSRGLTFLELDAIAAGCGPGSFTGVRLACSVAQGLSYSLEIPSIQVSSLEVMAEHFHKKYLAKEVVAIVNAHMNQIYIGHFIYNEELSSSTEVAINTEEFTISDFSLDTYFVGNGCELVKTKLEKIKSKIYEHYPNAIDLLTVARKKFNKGVIVSPENLLPVYLSGEEHWKK